MKTIALAAIFSLLQSGDQLTAPPQTIEAPAAQCICAESHPPAIGVLEGIVIDGELTLGVDGLSVNDRRATVFDAKPTTINGEKIFGRTRIFHTAAQASCGLSFDYGKRYAVPVRKSATGDLETDQCLIKSTKR